ncbi:hypothetical protein [Colwellia sp. PAMC 21821]|uniref:hypothetical protein n=1 Tax=Colwellia sp. PAMC 21821 TaxID=1816219 RepID=UPI0009BF5050|nr:hypothetical protein [Colwellia sp. PAMC 21821]ARD45868.1 hypothetical protein A3Q33_17160 [Colwellia sp. PAMC 21821]
MKNTLYQYAIEFVIKNAGDDFSSSDLDKYLVPEKDREKPKSINRLYQSILESAQNVQMSPNVIGKAISGEKGNIRPLGSFLSGFSPKKTMLDFGTLTDSELLNRILPTLAIQPHPEKRKLWLRYCKTITSAAKFLSQFETDVNFYEFIDQYYQDKKIRPFLPMLLSYEIDGIGFALACDFLKELGYVQYGKPDTHIKDIFIELGILIGASKQSSKADYLSLKIIDEIADINDITPYAVDKILWLVCSGNYYLDDLDIGNQKKAFISLVRELA